MVIIAAPELVVMICLLVFSLFAMTFLFVPCWWIYVSRCSTFYLHLFALLHKCCLMVSLPFANIAPKTDVIRNRFNFDTVMR